MTIGRTDDPVNPLGATAHEAAFMFGSGSRIPSGPAVIAPRRQGRTHERSRPARQPSHFSLASEGPSTHAPKRMRSATLSSITHHPRAPARPYASLRRVPAARRLATAARGADTGAAPPRQRRSARPGGGTLGDAGASSWSCGQICHILKPKSALLEC